MYTLTHIRIICASVLVFFSVTLLADPFSSTWFASSINNCSGTVDISMVLYNDDSGTANDDAWANGTKLQMKVGSGAYFDIGEMGTGTSGRTWNWDPNEDGGVGYSRYNHVRAQGLVGTFEQGSPDRQFGATIRITLAASDIGKSISFQIVGSWEDGGSSGTESVSSTILPTPTSVSASDAAACLSTTISWSNPSGLCAGTTAQIWRGNTWVKDVAASLGTAVDVGGVAGSVYEYKVRYYIGAAGGFRIYSNYSSFDNGSSIGPVSAPTSLSATDNNCESGEINVTWGWSGANPVNGFALQISTNSSFSGATTINLSGDRRSFNDTGKTLKTTYWYRIFAINACNVWSTSSNIDTGISPGKPSPPTNLGVTADNINNRIIITWYDRSNDEDEFVLVKTALGGAQEEIVVATSNKGGLHYQMTYYDDNVAGCRTYSYQIRSRNACGQSALSGGGSAKVQPNITNAFSSGGHFDASKGYFTDKVSMDWSLGNGLETVVEYFKVNRRILNSGTPFSELQQVNGGTFNDFTAEAGVLYEYSIVGYLLCENDLKVTAPAISVGFRSKTGIVNGNVTYTGGIAVEGVKIIAERDDIISYQSINVTGGFLSIAHNANQHLSDEMIVETWIKPEPNAPAFDIVNKVGSYILWYDGTSSIHGKVTYNSGQSKTVSIDKSMVPFGNWSHIAMQVRNDRLSLYVNGSKKASVHISSTVEIDDTANNIVLGYGLQGCLKEFRIWKQSKSDQDLYNAASRYAIGSEQGLISLLPMNEGTGGYVYDRSQISVGVFNRNHAILTAGATWIENAPTLSQLTYAAYTIANGNYTLKLPYTNAGTNYTLTPQFLTHEFDPRTRVLFVGDASSVLNGIDFIDISNFPVTGKLVYKDTPCPVEGAFIKIDGVNVIENGQAIVTDVNGDYSISVPIGEHYITVEKAGHVFSQGRFPSTGLYDFQEPVSGIEMEDSTLVKIVGRVVGGTREGNKIPGFDKSRNNIGRAKVMFDSQSRCIRDTVLTDSGSGEYTAFVPPLNYEPKVEFLYNNTVTFPIKLYDYSNTPIVKMAYDSLPSGEVDSIWYNERLDFVHRVMTPKIEVFDRDGVNSFIGDTSYMYTMPDGTTDMRDLRAEPFRWPLFSHFEDDYKYRCLIQVYENYANYDSGTPVFDKVPVTDGKLTFDNQLSNLFEFQVANPSVDVSKLTEVPMDKVNTPDSLKQLIYSFKLGFPNFSVNSNIAELSFTKTMEIAYIDENGVKTSWLPVPLAQDPSNTGIFRAYTLGSQSVGGQFYTDGPEVVDFVLRDPPGSGSSASRSVGSTKSETSSWSWSLGSEVHTEDKMSIGAKFLAGIGISTENEIKNETTVGFKAGISGGREGSQAISTTFTKTISTNSGTDQPGAGSDIFYGRSRNVEFSSSEQLVIVPKTLCDSMECYGPAFNTHRFAKKYGLTIEPVGYETTFIYNQDHIENILLPTLIDTRKIILQSDDRYSSYLLPSDPNYGKNNDDPVFGADATPEPDENNFADNDGKSYKYTALTDEDRLNDPVRRINTQINKWKEALWRNEWEKHNISNQTVIDSLEQVELDRLWVQYGTSVIAYNALIAANGIGGVVLAYGLIANPLPGTSISGFATFAVTSATGIAQAELAEERDLYYTLKERIEEKFNSIRAENKTISATNTFSSSISMSTATSNGGSIEYELNAGLKLEVEGKINNNGVGLEKGISLKYESARDWGTDTSSTEIIEYTLSDPDQGDFFSVDVYPSMLGWGPIFKTKEGGQTSCPHEDRIVSKYYKENDAPVVLSERTLQIDKPFISAAPKFLTNIPVDQPAVYTLTLKNDSEPAYPRTYNVTLVSSSNPFGAIARIDGSSSISPTIPGGSEITKTLTISKGAGPVYNYDSLLFIIYAPCQFAAGTSNNVDIVDSVYLSAHFLPTCTDVGLFRPEQNWVLNNSFNNTLPLVIDDYNINFDGLQELKFQYKPSEEPNWVEVQTFKKDTAGLSGNNLQPISASTPFTLYDWDVSMINDGSYDLRIQSECTLEDNFSITYSGLMDRINPHAFGTPSPADGILDPDDDILLTMNEIIEIGSVTSLNFDIRGVLNGSELRHETSLAFDGINDFLVIPEYQLQKRDLTIEFWLKRNSNGQEVILSQGLSSSDFLLIGFNSNDKLQFQLGDAVLESDGIITDNIWHHYAIVYDRENLDAEIIIDFVLDKANNNFITDYNSTGNIIIGKNVLSNSDYFDGNLSELRLWLGTKTIAEVTAKGNVVLSGREAGLIGNWPMNEGYGPIAKDKVRSRHATLYDATWSILPANHSFFFDGTNDYLEALNAGTLGYSEEADITIESWFKTGASKEQTIFSNGKADGSRPEDFAWALSVTPSGAVKIENDGQSLVTPTGYNDNSWHHISVVVERTKAVSMYIDGELVETGNASIFKGFAGPKIWIGCRGWIHGSQDSTDQFFNGNLDEIRVWNTARKPEQIQRDFTSQLIGEELGLQAYYPFDGVVEDLGILLRVPDRKDASPNDFDLTLGGGLSDQFSFDSPPIKLPRLVEKVNFTYSINNDQIFIEITDPPARIENVTLDITVDGIKDKAGNVMQSPETWIAYIDKNQVFWEKEYFNFEKDLEDNLSFSTNIMNTGGRQEQFTISNLPSWLTAIPSSGLIDPNSNVPVTFYVEPLLNIGEYEQDVFVSTESFGYNERLLLDLKVRVPAPEWEINEALFEHSMGIVGQFEINDVISTDIDDLISVWVNDTIRGVSHVEYEENIGKYLVFLDVYSNSDMSDEVLEFRAWDASAGRILVDLTPDDIVFVANSEPLGLRSAPLIINAFVQTELTYFLDGGWNWISFPLASSSLSNVNSAFTELSPSGGDVLYKNGQSIGYSNNSQIWAINSDFSSFNTNEGYKIRLSERDTFRYSGAFVNPTLEPITIVPEWNWIGVKSEFVIDVSTAMSSLDPQTGDLIKGQRQFAIYEEGYGWGGSLDFLLPQEGYMLKYHTNDSLYYPGTGLLNERIQDFEEVRKKKSKKREKSAGYVANKYNSNMSLTASIELCQALGDDPNGWILAAYAGAESRGVADRNHDGRYYLTIDGDASVPLSFKLIHESTQAIILLNENFLFNADGIVGLISDPFDFTCGGIVRCPDTQMLHSEDLTSPDFNMKYSAMSSLQSDGVLQQGYNLTLGSGLSVELLEGFEVKKGAELLIIIEECVNSNN